jgi:uncharacterized protein YkwD
MTIILSDGPVSIQSRGTLYFPFVATPPLPTVEPAEVETPEAAFFRLLTIDPRQQRVGLVWCESLAAAARWKAQDIATHDYWAHKASNGEFANTTARNHGCKLPKDYDGNWNGIESLSAGSPDALPIFTSLSNSPRHAEHLFGLNDFFRRQTHCGVAMAQGGRYGWVWCVLIAPCG